MNVVIIHGPQGCGKTRRSQQFKRHYQCTRIVDDWDGASPLKEGDLALTTLFPPFDVEGAKVIGYLTAAKEAA